MDSTKTDKDGILRLHDQFCFALYSTSRMVTKAYGVLLDALGLTYPQYLVMLVLWEEDGILVSDIAKALAIDGGTATPLIKRLENLGFVHRIRCQEDERRVRIYLTDLGKSSFHKALNVPHGLGDATGLTAESAHRIVAELDDIKAQIESWLARPEK